MPNAANQIGRSRFHELSGAYWAIVAFCVVCCARPQDWIPGLSVIPLAKVTGFSVLIACLCSLRQSRRRWPREVLLLVFLSGQLFLSAVTSTIWQGGALLVAIDFAKIAIVVVAISAVVSTSRQLRGLVFIQAASVAMSAAVSVWQGHQIVGRLEGTLGGGYSNSNDLALAVVVTLPLCLVLALLTKVLVWKIAWATAMLVMIYSLFLTGSRGGFISLVFAAAVCLWEFAVQGRRWYLIVLVAVISVILWQSSGEMLRKRLKGTFDSKENTASAYASAQQREQLFWRSVEVTENHPIFGVGPGNFAILSGNWHVTHNSFTEMSSEGGLPALVLYVAIIGYGFKNIRSAKRLARGPSESNLMSRALRASLAGYVVGSCFVSVAYLFFPYFLVIYTTASYRIAKATSFDSKESNSISRTVVSSRAYTDLVEVFPSYRKPLNES